MKKIVYVCDIKDDIDDNIRNGYDVWGCIFNETSNIQISVKLN